MFKPLEQFLERQQWLDDVGDPLQACVHGLFSGAGATGKQLKNFLNGTWLGHPLHPVVTDVPVGAWTCTFVLDTLGSFSDNESLETAADITLATGLAAAAGAAVTGFTDWTDTYGMERKLGLMHGLIMVSSFLAYTVSLLARRTGARGAGIALANVGYMLMGTGAYLGGEQVADLGYGVNHTAFLRGPTEFVSVMKESELQSDTPTKGDADGTAVLLVKQGSDIYALDDTCVHAGCSLAGGKLDGRSIICPCHGSQFDLRTGKVINGPATMSEPAYAVRVTDGTIEVKQL